MADRHCLSPPSVWDMEAGSLVAWTVYQRGPNSRLDNQFLDPFRFDFVNSGTVSRPMSALDHLVVSLTSLQMAISGARVSSGLMG